MVEMSAEKHRDPRSGFERAAENLIVSGKLHLAAALIINATSAINAENHARLNKGEEPHYTYKAFWDEIESIYDQLGLPHARGVILTDRLFGDLETE